jgi:anti-sigma factor RsiW
VPDCCPVEEAIAAYVHHNATPEERRLIEAHLVECDECSELVAFLVRWTNEELNESSGKAHKP